MSIVYSFGPIFAVPVGRIRFCALNALTTSEGVSPLASSARVSRSTEISARLAAVRVGHGRARNRHELRAQEVERRVVQLPARKASCSTAPS